MRHSFPLIVAFAAIAAAQDRSNAVNNPSGGIQATAGKPLTLSWELPSNGPITIKIQTSGEVTPDEGIIVAKGIENTGAATFVMPESVPSGQVYLQIIDDSDPENYNFSQGFEVEGASGTAADDTAISVDPAASATALPSDASVDISITASTAPDTASASETASETESDMASETETASETNAEETSSTSSRASRTPTSSQSSQSTSAPSSGENAAPASALASVRNGLIATVVLVAGLALL